MAGWQIGRKWGPHVSGIKEYADDLTYATTSDNLRTHIKNTTATELKAYNRFVNMEMTEEGEAPDKRLLCLTKILASNSYIQT